MLHTEKRCGSSPSSTTPPPPPTLQGFDSALWPIRQPAGKMLFLCIFFISGGDGTLKLVSKAPHLIRGHFWETWWQLTVIPSKQRIEATLPSAALLDCWSRFMTLWVFIILRKCYNQGNPEISESLNHQEILIKTTKTKATI